MTVAAQDLQQALDWCRGLHVDAAQPMPQLAADSRAIQAGDIFIAYPNGGQAHVEHAIQNGARGVIHDAAETQATSSIKHHALASLRQRAGELANRYYGAPDRAMQTIAVTGTNGKTSCTQWLGAALSQLGRRCAVIGTLGVGVFDAGQSGAFETTGYTTPDAVQLQRTLARLARDGIGALAVEASSIGLAEYRLDGMHIDTALFTNLSRDHLDYHGDMDAYEAAKNRLFDWPGLRHAVINLDDPAGQRLVQRLQQQATPPMLIGYSLQADLMLAAATGLTVLRATEIRSTAAGTAFKIDSPFGSAQLKTQLVGNFNVGNSLAVIGALLAQGSDWRAALGAIEKLTSVPGRMQQLGGHDAPLVVIDYAHTPDALRQVLGTLRPVAQQRGGALWCVFGCGGERDAGKRPQMGAAATLADQIVITSDNPRSENPAAIIAQILAGIDPAGVKLEAIEDRANAILLAVKRAARADVILLAGKGHETTQQVGAKKFPFSDQQHAALALAARATNQGFH